MSAAFFADMDSTTIYTKRHFAEREGGYNGLVVVDTYLGEPLSFMTYDAVQKLGELSRRLSFVPTTTRDQTQFSRIAIPGIRSNTAIVANGGKILVDGLEDKAWSAYIEQMVRPSEAAAVVLASLKAAFDGEPWTRNIRSCADLFVYVVATDSSDVPDWFGPLMEERARGWGYTVSVQGRTTYLLPLGLTKEAAAAEVASRLGAATTFGSGDSRLDVGLMEFAEHAIRPRHGELDGYLTGIPSTFSTGLDAGLEILEFVEQVLDSTTAPRMALA